MDIHIERSFSKTIKIPLEQAYINADKYKYLNEKTIKDCVGMEDIDDIQTFPFGSSKPSGIVVIFKEVLKPNVLFHFSKQLDVDRFISDKIYAHECQFYYWPDESGHGNIRIARPNPYANDSISYPLVQG
jgi:hypothetical protein